MVRIKDTECYFLSFFFFKYSNLQAYLMQLKYFSYEAFDVSIVSFS